MLNSETQLSENETKTINQPVEAPQQQQQQQQQQRQHQEQQQNQDQNSDYQNKINQHKHSQLNNPLDDHDYCSPNKMCVKRDTLLTEEGSSMDSSSNTGIKIKKERQPRQQSISVTDKSQWITGDEEIESALSEHLSNKKPRERRPNSGVKEPDPAFSQYTSSEYSVSDEESDDQDSDDDYNSEDDPDRLWCICQKPHDGKFMICCDVCKDWFHGHCVGVTKLMGDRFEKQGKEWFCGECMHKIKSGTPRSAIPTKIVLKEKEKKKKSKNSMSGKRGRGRPKKSDSSMKDGPTRMLRSSRKSSSSLDPKLGVDNGRLKKNLARSDVRSESFDEFQDSQKLKELIRERKKAFFYKRQLAAQQKAARRSELGLGNKQTLTSNLSESLDSLATSTSTPNMNNLPINIKERSEPNIVLQINIKKDPGSDQNNSNSRIVTTIVRSPKKTKHVDSINPIVNDLFTADPIQINKKVVKNPTNSSSTTGSSTSSVAQTAGGDNTNTSTSNNNNTSSNSTNNNNSNGDTSVRKRSNSSNFTIKKEKHKNDSGEHEGPTPKKKRKDSESSLSNGSATPVGSQHFVKKIKETLELRSKQITGIQVSGDKIEQIATAIESSLNDSFKEGTHKYRNKYASIIFNLKDPKNQGLARNVLMETISPSKLVNMSPDELASSELAKWRERENKHSIELIKRDAELAAQQVIVKKTHKGEEIISASLPNESEDASAKVDNQETPTTPNKLSTKDIPRVDSSKITLTPPVIKPPTIEPIDYDLNDSEDEEEDHPLDRSPNKDSYMESFRPTTNTSNCSEECWVGTITMPDIVKFSALAKSVSGPLDVETGGIEENMMVCGRIPPDQVQSYIKKLKLTTKNQISMIQLFPKTDDDKNNFNELCDYLYKRNRYGVIQTNPQILKDFYIIPIFDNGNIPDVLKSTIKGQGIDRKEPNCLLGLLVKNKRPTTTVSSSSSLADAVYTPTPIN